MAKCLPPFSDGCGGRAGNAILITIRLNIKSKGGVAVGRDRVFQGNRLGSHI